MFFLYNLLLAFVLTPYFLVRGLRRRTYYRTLSQRLGFSDTGPLDPAVLQTARPNIWLHAVSVGEILSCAPLLEALRKRLPNTGIVVSTTTETGHKIALEKLGALADAIFYAPFDLPFAVRRTLRRVKPRVVIVAETEIWPNLFRETKRAGASLLLVNARMSDRSAPRYRRFRSFFRRVLCFPNAILAQTPLDRQRLIDAGAPSEKVDVGGNLKFDFRAPQGEAPAEILALLDRARPSAIILAGSTRETEEEQVLSAFRQVSGKHPDSLLIVAPRHPERFDAVARLLSEAGFAFLRRSNLAPGASLRLPGVLLLDSLGELASLYALAQVVFVGGSLVDWGGHNVLEPAFAERPIVVGPHMQNFRAVADALLAAEAMVQVDNADDLGLALLRLLENPQQAAVLGARARRVAELHRGATERAVDRAEALYHRAVPNDPPGLAERVLLWLPARVWEAAARLRNHAYDQGRLATRKLGAPVISIGNLTAGGTGKTPVLIWLIEQIESRGLSCAVLTRGYHRASSQSVLILEPGARASAAQTGDEAQFLLRRFSIPIGIAADRYRCGAEVERRFHPDLLLLDDGFQHRRLARDLDVVLIDVTAPFGRRELLPLGRLREPISSLARAGVLVLTRAESWERWDGLVEQLRVYNQRAPIFFARIEPVALVNAATGEEKPPSEIQRRPAFAFCGVANPDSFWRDLERIGVPAARRAVYRDHHRYSPAELARLLAAARECGAEWLVTTEKDLMNLPEIPPALFWLKTRVTIDRPEELLDLVLSRAGKGALLRS